MLSENSKTAKSYNQQNLASYLVNVMHPKQEKSKIPKPMIVYFMLLQFFFGMNLGFDKIFVGKKQRIIKTVTNIMSLIISTILIAHCKMFYATIWYWSTLSKYTLNFFTFNCLNMPQYKMYHFLTEVHDRDENILAIENNVFGSLILTYTCMMWFLKGAFLIIRCTDERSNYCHKGNVYLYSLFTTYTLSADTTSGLLIVILYYVHSLVTYTKKLLAFELDFIKFEKRYIAIADFLDKIKPVYDYFVITELCSNIPRLMSTLWCMLLFIKEKAEWYYYMSEWIFAFHMIIQICIPAVIAEMVNYQIEAVKLILIEQRREEKDPQTSAELTRVLRYVKTRKLRSCIWRIVPIDLRLPMAMFSIFTTYFIVILQFTHIYD